MRAPDRVFGGYVFDLGGTVYLGDELLPASATHRPEAHAKMATGD